LAEVQSEFGYGGADGSADGPSGQRDLRTWLYVQAGDAGGGVRPESDSPEEVFNCENGSIVVAGHRIHDHKKYGELTVAEILANSSDVGAIKIALKLGPQDSTNTFTHLVSVLLQEWTCREKAAGWCIGWITGVHFRSAPFDGQEVGVTPLQMINAVSAVANGGLLYRPRVVVEMRRGNRSCRWTARPRQRSRAA